MKNVITILIDSVNADFANKNYTGVDSIPFIDSLKEKSVFCNSIYSYGPYTDAASKGLFCFENTMSNYGYYFQLNEGVNNNYKLFKELGYETYGYWYPYYLIGKDIRKNIDHITYTSGFEYGSIWNGKLEYYSNRKNELSENEYRLLIECMDLVFDCWQSFYENIEENKRVLINYENERINGGGLKELEKEHSIYLKNKRMYINDLLSKGMEHPLVRINEYQYGKNENITFLDSIFKEYKDFFKKVRKVNIKYNIKNNHIQLGKIMDNIINLRKGKDESRYILNYFMLLFYDKFMIKRYKDNGWRNVPSFNKQVDLLIDDITKRDNNNIPFYASLHVEEAHHNFCFFSYDCYDMDQIKKEFDYLKPILEIENRNYKGNIAYLLSLRYIDLCVKKLFNELKENNMLDNTTIMLMSDHGTSFFFDPPRSTVVNNFYKENYKIPLLIYDSSLNNKGMKYDGMYCSDDIFPTLIHILGINKNISTSGKSILKNTEGRDYVIIEYMGPGVPDMFSKEIWMSIRNNHYSISFKNRIDLPLNTRSPYSIFDLINDPKELKNIKNTSNNEIEYLIGELNKRYIQIQKDSCEFINKLAN